MSERERFRTPESARSAIVQAYGENAAASECGIDGDIRRMLLDSFHTAEPSRASYENGSVTRNETAPTTRTEIRAAVQDVVFGDHSPEGLRASCVDVADTPPRPFDSAFVVTAGDCTLFFCTVQKVGIDGQRRWVFTDTAGRSHTGPPALHPLREAELRDFVWDWWAARKAE